MNVFLAWTDFKAQVSDKALVRFTENELFYSIRYLDFDTSIDFSNTTDKTDFDTNYKPHGNKAASPSVTVEKISPYGAKTFMSGTTLKKLYARNPGIQQAVIAGVTNIDYTVPYPWAKIVGLEIINGEALDKVDLQVVDTAAGTYSGISNYVLNQFSSAYNVAPGYHKRDARFDADLYVNMIIRIIYTSISSKTVAVNFIMDEVKS